MLPETHMEKLSKELLGLAGEYAVASEVCKRGFYGQLTLGHHKRTDILIETDTKMLRLQVKAKQGSEWPAVSGLYRPDDILILVDFARKELLGRLDFYVLTLTDWVQLVSEEQKRYPDMTVDSQNRVRHADGFCGINIKASHVADHKDRWDKIAAIIKPSETA
jgi:hypothetical protein